MFESPPSSGRCTALLADVRALCRDLDPATLPTDAVPQIFDCLVAMGRLVDGAITRLAPRYERSGAWQDRGAKNAADAIARSIGTSPADSKRRLATGHQLASQPRLDEAVRAGRVSAGQAQVIAGAAHGDRDEEQLIATAVTSSHRTLLEEAARTRARADRDEHDRRVRQRALRRLHRWTDADGMYNLHLRTLPEHGAEIDARLAPCIDRVFAAARKEGRREPVPAYGADAVVEALRGTSTTAPSAARPAARPERKVIALVDIDALNRGHRMGDETCELAGVGPVSVAAVRALFGDAAMAVVFRDAVDIRSVVHLGRQVTAQQRTALEARGPVCAIPGCGSTHRLEIDHATGWAYTRTTSIDDLDWLCSTDHAFKTRHDLLAIGPPGKRVLVERDPTDPTRPRRPLVQVRPAPSGAQVQTAPEPVTRRRRRAPTR